MGGRFPLRVLLWLGIVQKFAIGNAKLVLAENGTELFAQVPAQFNMFGMQAGTRLENWTLFEFTEEEYERFCVDLDWVPERMAHIDTKMLIQKGHDICKGHFGGRLEMKFPKMWTDRIRVVLDLVDGYPGLFSNSQGVGMNGHNASHVAFLGGRREIGMKLHIPPEGLLVTLDIDENDSLSHWAIQVWFRGIAPVLYFLLACKSCVYMLRQWQRNKLTIFPGYVLFLNIIANLALCVSGATYGMYFLTPYASATVQAATFTAFLVCRSTGDFVLGLLYYILHRQLFKNERNADPSRFGSLAIIFGLALIGILDFVPLLYANFPKALIAVVIQITTMFVVSVQSLFIVTMIFGMISFRRKLANVKKAPPSIRRVGVLLNRCILISATCSLCHVVVLVLFSWKILDQNPEIYITGFIVNTIAIWLKSHSQIQACAPHNSSESQHSAIVAPRRTNQQNQNTSMAPTTTAMIQPSTTAQVFTEVANDS